jgi:hypothetical protein
MKTHFPRAIHFIPKLLAFLSYDITKECLDGISEGHSAHTEMDRDSSTSSLHDTQCRAILPKFLPLRSQEGEGEAFGCSVTRWCSPTVYTSNTSAHLSWNCSTLGLLEEEGQMASTCGQGAKNLNSIVPLLMAPVAPASEDSGPLPKLPRQW